MKSSLSFGVLLTGWKCCQSICWGYTERVVKHTIDTVDIRKFNRIKATTFCRIPKYVAADSVSGGQRGGERTGDEASKGNKRDKGGSYICS